MARWLPSQWTKANTQSVGAQTEKLARHYLESQGLIFRTANFRCKLGEIDLIMQQDATWVFVEVKYRRKSHFGGALAALSISKQQKITKTAHYFLQQSQLNAYNTACRFDVIALQGSLEAPEITWLSNAF